MPGIREPGFKGVFISYYATLCAAFAAIGGMVFGYDQGVVSVILVMPQFLARFTRVSETAPGAGFYKGLMTAMIELGAFLGAFNQGWIADKYSRKHSIVIAVVIFTIGSVVQTAAMDYAMLTVGRLVGGIGIGMLSMVAPLYISEISPPEVRGSLLVLEEFCIVFGIVVAFWITYGTRYMSGEWAWRLPFLLQMVPSTVLGIGILFFPFSPRWLASKGRDSEALQSLGTLRQLPVTDHRVQQEWFDIRAEVAFHRQSSAKRHPTLQSKSNLNSIKLELVSWMDCFRKGCWRRTHVGVGLMFFQVRRFQQSCKQNSSLTTRIAIRRHKCTSKLPQVSLRCPYGVVVSWNSNTLGFHVLDCREHSYAFKGSILCNTSSFD